MRAKEACHTKSLTQSSAECHTEQHTEPHRAPLIQSYTEPHTEPRSATRTVLRKQAQVYGIRCTMSPRQRLRLSCEDKRHENNEGKENMPHKEPHTEQRAMSHIATHRAAHSATHTALHSATHRAAQRHTHSTTHAGASKRYTDYGLRYTVHSPQSPQSRTSKPAVLSTFVRAYTTLTHGVPDLGHRRIKIV